MISAGQSFGAISALKSAFDDQPYFKAVLTHDTCFFPFFKQIDEKSLILKHPVQIIMSESFLGTMNSMIFNIKDRDLWKDTDNLI